ncbi:MAG TPA: TetR/AcrR family transcriptional regulator [Solirubrobacterales bacterium]|nr:TetR/AcrR family transcriptional regulator [Solirubrobacterales bacterium]
MSSKTPAEHPHHPDELAQLPHGRHGLPPEFVERNQRERLIASFIAVVGEVGYSGATITAVTEGAAVASRTFYKYFNTVEEVCVAAFAKGVEDLRPLVGEAYESESEWPLRIRAVIAAILSDFAEYPELARLLTAEPFVAGPEIARLHKAAIEELVPFLRQGRELRAGGEPLPDTAERGILGALNSMVGRQVTAGRGEELEDLLPDLTQFVLTPYLGAAEARRLAMG